MEVSVGAIWQKKAKSGVDYLSISMTNADGTKSSFVAFKNDKAEGNRPNYNIYKQKTLGSTTGTNNPIGENAKPVVTQATINMPQAEIDLTQIPF